MINNSEFKELFVLLTIGNSLLLSCVFDYSLLLKKCLSSGVINHIGISPSRFLAFLRPYFTILLTLMDGARHKPF